MSVCLWWVEFEEPGTQPSVQAATEDEAKVLGQAMRIKAGQEWRRVKGAIKVGEVTPRRKHVNTLAG